MTTPSPNSNRSAGAVPSTMPVELAAFLDLVAELIATAVWQGAGGSPAPGEPRGPA